MAATKKAAAPKGGNVFTRKLGPLPGWVWVVGGVGIIAVYQRTIGKNKVTTDSDGTGTATTTADALNYYPQQPYAGGGQSGGNLNDNNVFASLLSILAAGMGQNQSPSPGNSSGGTVAPGSTGNPGLQTTTDSSSSTPVYVNPITNPIPASVPVPIASALPATPTQIVNPIAGDSSAVVVGKDSNGLGFVYGGSQAQANLLTGGSVSAPAAAPYAPNPAAPVQLQQGQGVPQANGQANYYVTPDGYGFTYG